MTKNRTISGNALIKWCNWLINHVSKTKKTSLSGFENKIKHPLNLNLRIIHSKVLENFLN